MSDPVTTEPGVELSEVDIAAIPKSTGVCALLFPLDHAYSTLTQVELADDKFMTWKKWKAFTVCFPFLVRKVGDVEPNTGSVVSCLDSCDDITGMVSCCGIGLDYLVQKCIWGGPKPPLSYLLETRASKDGEVSKTYILRDKRSPWERMCKIKTGHWSLFELGKEKDEEMIMKANYTRTFYGMRTHYVMKDKDGTIMASHQLKPPMCYCDCNCKRLCCAPCYMCAKCCDSYVPIATYMTPDSPTTEHPKYKPDYKVKEGVRLMGLSCIGLCCGKSHEAVKFPTFYGAGKDLPPPEADPEEDGEKKIKRGDNRVLVKDVNPCAKTLLLFTPSFEDLGDMGEMAGMGELVAVAAEVAQEAADLKGDIEDEQPEGDVDKKAGQGNVKWARSKNDTYGIEFPTHFTSAQRCGMVLAALEYDELNAN